MQGLNKPGPIDRGVSDQFAAALEGLVLLERGLFKEFDHVRTLQMVA